ncbi:hypothetical protein JTE90_007104 [Oedothorax gibbosus]|uniref:Bleomycin hydrolase n=1 Tax=Oedothorax gibbosus TaxID=931172 RepID=A0AAV6VRL2_9ARAC|nr:hypothetical protein JTE90_007104 [Oedothorax gibbosus]
MGTQGNGALTDELLKSFRKKLYSEPKNILALNACVKSDPLEVCVQRRVAESSNHVFTHKVDAEIKPMTNQKNSGRCWLFACLNVLRIPFAKHHQIEDFEFSQTYLFFCDKIERANFFLHTILKLLQRGEPIDGRLMSFLLHDPVADGGQWDMVVNIVNKYGVMPKKCFGESFCSEASHRMNGIIKTKVREYTKELQEMVQNKSSQEKLEEKIVGYMEELYRVISICIGVPPESFTWEYYNKNKAYNSVGPITPLKFYEEYVKPHVNVDDLVCLVHDPRPENPIGKTYTVDCLGNMVGGRPVLYINQEVKDLMKYAAESIKKNEPVWFGCDVGKRYNLKLGIQDLKIHDYQLMFGIDIHKSMKKAERLVYGDTCMNHAMTFTGVSVDLDGNPTKFRVENSWGDDKSDKGYMMMTREWFEEFGFEVVVDKKHLPKEVIDMLQIPPKVLPAWDPMGTLAS